MRTEMSKAEAITRIDRFLAYLEKIYTPQCDYEEALIRKDDITAFVIARDALKEQRKHGEWKNERFSESHALYFGKCSQCGKTGVTGNFCSVCGSDNRKMGEAE